jgi:hypothetical protein
MTEKAFGIQGFTADDQRVVAGSRFSVVRDAVFANPYQKVWGRKGTRRSSASRLRSCR